MLARWCILAWIVLTHLEGIYLFLSGFLLNRTVIPQYSQCHGPDTSSYRSKLLDGCWLPRRFNKSIVLVIDALRFDFMEMHNLPPGQKVAPFQNKLSVINSTLTAYPGNSRLYKFIADPPTATMQRLKGLTTGSLPTFVDVGSNFASAAIDEDNWLEQLRRRNCSTVFMGDDTWMQLFPDAFTRSWPFPSFNVKDLHTVDNGIIANLVPQIRGGEWDVLIAHFLGVDHCGHRFGPEHPAMAEKLMQMNDVIRSVMSALSEDTILFVLGDHGMTWSGDHGGDSFDEVISGLFIYSKQPLGTSLNADKVTSVAQVDFVPTLSLLLGLPIPFNNLGAVIPDLFSLPVKGTSLLHALHVNSQQVNRFLQTYQAMSSDLPEVEFLHLAERHKHLSAAYYNISGHTLHHQKAENNAIYSHRDYLREAQTMCRQVWARFDVFRMVCGIAVLAFSSLATALLSVCVPWLEQSQICFRKIERACLLVSVCVSAGSVTAVLLDVLPPYLAPFLIAMVTASSIAVSCIQKFWRDIVGLLRQHFLSLYQLTLPSIFLLAHTAAFFSNSFVVREDSIMLFSSLSLLTIVGLMSSPVLRSHSRTAIIHMLTLVFSLLVMRLARVFRGCREEQHDCSRSSFLLHSSTALSQLGWLGYIRLVSCCSVVLVLPFILRRQLQQRSLRPSSHSLWWLITYALPLSGTCVAGHFALQSLPQQQLDSLPGWIHVFCPRVVYLICCAVSACMFLYPMFQATCKHHYSAELRLLQSLSTSTVVLVISLWLPLVMLLGDGLVPGGVLVLLEIGLVLWLISHNQTCASWLHTCLWSALAGLFYFTTGHQYDLPSIRHDAAFVGLHGDVENFVLPALLVICNMFSSQILFSLTVPLLSITVQFQSLWHQQESTSNPGTGCVIVAMFQSCLMFLVYHSVTLTGAAVAALALRRHLMVWKIFAPRLLYAAVSMLVVDASTLLAFGLVTRIISVTSWRKLHKPHEHVT